MDIDTFVALISLVALVISYIGYRYCCNNVYLTYKEQRVGNDKRKHRK